MSFRIWKTVLVHVRFRDYKMDKSGQDTDTWENLPATMSVNVNPFFTVFLWTWFGRVAKPTYSLSWSCGNVRYPKML